MPAARKRFQLIEGSEWFDSPALSLPRARNLFVLVSALELPSVADFVSIANRRHQLRALFVRDVIDARWLPQAFERAGLRTLRNTLVHSDATVPRRVLAAWLQGAQSELMAEARVADDRLFVVSCALEPYELEFAKMPALHSIPEAERLSFEIDEDGSYIHWPASDVHVDIDAIRAALEPRLRMRALAAKAIATAATEQPWRNCGRRVG